MRCCRRRCQCRSCRCQFYIRYSVHGVKVCFVCVRVCVLSQKHRHNFSVMLQMSRHLAIKMNEIIKSYLIYTWEIQSKCLHFYVIIVVTMKDFKCWVACYSVCNNLQQVSFMFSTKTRTHHLTRNVLNAFMAVLYIVESFRVLNFFYEIPIKLKCFLHSIGAITPRIQCVHIMMMSSLPQFKQFKLKMVQLSFQANQTISCLHASQNMEILVLVTFEMNSNHYLLRSLFI